MTERSSVAVAIPHRSQSSNASARQRPYLSLGEAAEYLGVSESTFHRIRGQEWMPRPISLASKILRWSVIELDEALRTRAPRATLEPEPETLQVARQSKTTGVLVRNGRIVKAIAS